LRLSFLKFLPGDLNQKKPPVYFQEMRLFPNPTLKWTNALTIDTPPDRVWGWIAQMGDTRAGFYSYTFVENRLARLFPDYQVGYKNAAVLVNARKHPAPRDELIKDILVIRDLQEGQWILSETIEKDIFHWGWLWYLEPLSEGQQTRMLVRFLVKVVPELESPCFLS
jgi:hypothetical protein